MVAARNSTEKKGRLMGALFISILNEAYTSSVSYPASFQPRIPPSITFTFS